jgi:hypothetical protein
VAPQTTALWAKRWSRVSWLSKYNAKSNPRVSLACLDRKASLGQSGCCKVAAPSLREMTINGLPLHPLVVHAAVVFVPLAALSVLAFVVPPWRWAARWPALVLVALAAGAVQLAAMTGDSLQHQVGRNPLVENHEMWAGRLQAATWVLAGLTLVAFWCLPHVTRLQGGEDREGRVAVLARPLVVLLPLAAVAVIVLVVLTGDAGARAVWGH